MTSFSQQKENYDWKHVKTFQKCCPKTKSMKHAVVNITAYVSRIGKMTLIHFNTKKANYIWGKVVGGSAGTSALACNVNK
jgi:hypothetical protein